MKNAKVHELLLQSDVFLNVPVLKNHGGANMTITMKNLMGVVWDRKFWHANDLNQCIADFPMYRKPDLNIVDAYRVMKRYAICGVSVDDIITMKSQIITTDMVAADTAGCKRSLALIRHLSNILPLLNSWALGTSDLDKLNISRIKV